MSIRRLYVPAVRQGTLELPDTEAHHARDVLRLAVGDAVELFDDAGHVAPARLARLDRRSAVVEVTGSITPPPVPRPRVVVASAVPKGDRADWMIEKLGELGVSVFVPLIAARSVVAPRGEQKAERWRRIAIESAKQSARPGVMRLDPPTPLASALASSTGPGAARFFLTTQGPAEPLATLPRPDDGTIELFIGPEGGWTDSEHADASRHGLRPARLTATLLRIETAALTAAALILCTPRPR